MFEVVPEPEFEAWYENLPEPWAEEVTTAIDLVASESGLAQAERLSSLLLWFDGTATAGMPLAGGTGSSWELLEASAVQARTFVQWHHAARRYLDSPAFQARLRALPNDAAARALRQVELLRRRFTATRWTNALNVGHGLQGVAPGVAALRLSFSTLQEAVGVDPETWSTHQSGLRELVVSGVAPPLRVLLGLDLPGQRLLAISGEALDRRYYGDSVRRAEKRWREYCAARAALGVELAP
jgi:hypothetical protein